MFLICCSAIHVHAADKVQLNESARACAQCHGNKFYTMHNSVMDVDERKRMNPYFVIDTSAYLQGEHHAFACDDCHSPDYATYPHAGELKLDPNYSCIDCHGGDEAYAHLQFDEIEEQVQQSVHAKALGESFKCELCHNPHTNQLVASSSKYSIQEIVQHNNNTCLYCHDKPENFNFFSDSTKPEIAEIHDWLPNQALHFKNVRCIECHTPTEDTFMVSHKILPKEQAVRNCRQCHSKNNLLSDKLYKYMNKEARNEDGVYTAVMENQAYLIGANRNRFLNVLGILLVSLTAIAIAIHIVLRIRKKK